MMFDQRLTVSRQDTIAVVMFDRPQRRNAFDLAMWHGLREIMGALSADGYLRRAVLRGGRKRSARATISAPSP